MSRANHETRLQIVVVQYLHTALSAGAVFWSVPNGGKMSAAARRLAAAMGEYPGASDLMVLWLGQLHCIELKVRANPALGIKRTTYQSAEQKAFEAAVDAQGAPYAVCRSIDDVRAALAEWCIPTREAVR